jgi:hypothetical protein
VTFGGGGADQIDGRATFGGDDDDDVFGDFGRNTVFLDDGDDVFRTLRKPASMARAPFLVVRVMARFTALAMNMFLTAARGMVCFSQGPATAMSSICPLTTSAKTVTT